MLAFLFTASPSRAEIVFDYRDVAHKLEGTGWQKKLEHTRRAEICEAMRAVSRAPECLPGWRIEVEADYRLFTLRARRLPADYGATTAPGLASAAQ